MGAFFSKWRVPFFTGYFLSVAVIFSPYVENFLGLSIVLRTKISHAFATRVVPNMSPWESWEKLRDLVDLLRHSGAHIFI